METYHHNARNLRAAGSARGNDEILLKIFGAREVLIGQFGTSINPAGR